MCKVYDRQYAHLYVSTAIYCILCDDPENPQRDYDVECAEEAIRKLEDLVGKQYPDIYGNYTV